MAAKLDQHSLIAAIKQLALTLGRTPTRVEFQNEVKGGSYALRKFYQDNFSKCLDACELPTYRDRMVDPGEAEKLLRKYRSLCLRKEQIQGFFRHVLDLDEMFRRAGNPPVLKISGMPDTHVKFRDVPAVSSYLKFMQWYRPHVHLIFGDFPDCEGISHWPESSLEPRRLVPEMKEARTLLEDIVKVTPECSTRIYLEGNHEHWIELGLSKMPELFEGLEDLGIEISLKKLLNLEKFEYELFPMNHLVQIGKAHFTHGIYTGTHHAKKHLDVFKTNIYYGHLHDRQVFQQTSVEGCLEAASQGCLAKLDAKFLKGKPNNWAHGHGVWEFFKDGSFVHYWVPIFGGISSFAGNIFDGNEQK